jgi:hypothetical protein
MLDKFISIVIVGYILLIGVSIFCSPYFVDYFLNRKYLFITCIPASLFSVNINPLLLFPIYFRNLDEGFALIIGWAILLSTFRAMFFGMSSIIFRIYTYFRYKSSPSKLILYRSHTYSLIIMEILISIFIGVLIVIIPLNTKVEILKILLLPFEWLSTTFPIGNIIISVVLLLITFICFLFEKNKKFT